MFSRTACIVGLHQWSEWGWKRGALHTCTQVKTCKRCGANSEKSLTLHKFNEWKYLGSDSCHQERVCQICGEKQTHLANHIWSSWEYESPDSCIQVRGCMRCTWRVRQVFHEWSEWEDSDYGKKRFCVRCKEGEYETTYESSYETSSTDYNSDDYKDIGSGWTGVGPTGRG